MSETPQQKAAWAAIAAIYLAIEEFGPSGVPSGHLYAAVMSKINLDNYNAIIEILVKVGKITNKGHLLTATKFTK